MKLADRFIVDTTVLIDLSKLMAGADRQIDDLIDAGAELGMCAVNVAEFFTGIPPEQVPRWHSLMSKFHYWDISEEAAARAGAYRYALRRRGLVLSLPDALIAGVAAMREATVLTDNLRHFRLLGLPVRPLRPHALHGL